MATFKWDQVNFTRGEIDPRVYVRTDWPNYYKAAKQIRNCICIPQGGVTRRWGTSFVTTLNTSSANYIRYNSVEIFAMPYNDECVYLLICEDKNLSIILEGIKIFNTTTIYTKEDIANLRFTQVEKRIVITDGNHVPYMLARAPSNNQIISYTPNSNFFIFSMNANQYSIGTILPVLFTNIPAEFSSTPSLFINRVYFIKVVDLITQTTVKVNIFTSMYDALNSNNPFFVPNIPNFPLDGNILNQWNLTPITFVTVPSYDFNANYLSSAVTFNITGGVNPGGANNPIIGITTNPVTIACTGATPFTSQHVGGLFNGGGGILRIRTFVDGTKVTGITIKPFDNNNPIPGDLAYIGEPAWSETRGWPKVSAYYQNRMIFSNTWSIPNGQWLSVINSVFDFDDSDPSLADNAISSYPSSGGGGIIKSITSARSLLVHTTKGNYSTPIQTEIAATPSSYMLIEHNKFGVGNLQPAYVDNQLFFVDYSGNNIITMSWDFIQGNYVTNSISIAASYLISNPVDMAAFTEPQHIDGFYVLFINGVKNNSNNDVDGSLCILQTLKEEDILAFSLAKTSTFLVAGQNGEVEEIPSTYLKVESAENRCWFLVNRTFLQQRANYSITLAGISANDNSFTTGNHGLILNNIYRVIFDLRVPAAANSVIPNMTPAVSTTSFFFAVPITANKICIYGSLADAKARTNVYIPNTIGVGYILELFDVVQKLCIEEVDFNYYTDISTQFNSANATQTIQVNPIFNGLSMQVTALDNAQQTIPNVLQNRVIFKGQINIERPSVTVNIGTQFTSTLVPLPPVLPENPGMLFNPRHIRTVYVGYYNTIGATIQGYGIPTQNIGDIVLGDPPNVSYGNGVFCYSPMEGWAGLMQNDLVISQPNPLPMTITGLSYIVDIAK